MIILFASCGIQKCPVCENAPPYPKAHQIYRGKFYDTYDCGIYLLEHQCFQKAIETFDLSITDRYKDQRFARTYSNHFIDDYFPHREKGIALYYLGEFEKAYTELSLSIDQYVSEKAQYFLDKVKTARFQAKGIAPTQPKIVVKQNQKWITREYPVIISGKVIDSQFVSNITIDDQTVFQECSSQMVSFDHPLFLEEGSHRIHIKADNLNKGESHRSIVIHLDRTGPQIIVNESENSSVISGVVVDHIGLNQIRLNNQMIHCQGKKRVPFQTKLRQSSSTTFIHAEDLAGNITEKNYDHLKKSEIKQLLVASRDESAVYAYQRNDCKKSSIYLMIDEWKSIDYTFRPDITIQGEVISGYTITHLTINHKPLMIEADKRIIFSKTLHLSSGKNHIDIQAINQKGQTEVNYLTITRHIPDAQKIKNRFRLAVYSFDSISWKSETDHFFDAFMSALIDQNRFLAFPREKDKKQSSLWSLLFAQSEPILADAIVKGRIIKKTKDIEIFVPVVSLDSTILAYADIYIPQQQDYNLSMVMKRLVEKLKTRFPLVQGSITHANHADFCLKDNSLISPQSKIFPGFPVYLYRQDMNDPFRGCQQTIIGFGEVNEMFKTGFCAAVHHKTNMSLDNIFLIVK